MCNAGEDRIISAARDKSVRMWFRTTPNTFGDPKIFLGHLRFVNSVAYIGPSAEYPSGMCPVLNAKYLTLQLIFRNGY